MYVDLTLKVERSCELRYLSRVLMRLHNSRLSSFMQLELTLAAPRLDPSIYQRQCPPRPHHNLSSPVPYPLDRGDPHHFTLTLSPGAQIRTNQHGNR